MKLIDSLKQWLGNTKQLHKLWSVRLSALGAFFMSIELAYGAQITIWWQTSAADYFPFLSPLLIKWIGLGLVITGVVVHLRSKGKNDGG
ncbi:hypothetical protein P255_01413 [Acinetobacter brisouii CIP 110357]|uniref:Uncharacterized protein n=1 Tax=Acinetobacter brisouii CIP 110357 TaxID=1341683 RepID=V2VT55_9GAMM|nr:hypothetical protein [Acinetobacter brisouii]ENV46061.1 hypothetical protein F954_02887 [Acinetobacter brisouii ANC 4119]ESK50914.1 hypothetical protein P255_01413 [Acinetobacter brisouii CIP 110357]